MNSIPSEDFLEEKKDNFDVLIDCSEKLEKNGIYGFMGKKYQIEDGKIF